MILGDAALSVDPWWVVIAFALITAVGLWWAIKREQHMLQMAIAHIQAMGAMGKTLENISHAIQKEESISQDRREEFVRLVLDVERRQAHQLRDFANQINLARHHGTTVSISGDNAHVAQGHSVDQGRI